MPTPGVGDDIEDVCSRCGDTWHVVMAKVGERIAKVVCKRCGGQHSYRGPEGSTPAASGGGGPGKRMMGRRRTTKPNLDAVAVPPPVFDPDKPPRPYSARDLYAPGERIVHPTFGTGVVAAAPGPGKVDVVFPSGNRTLACAKAESTLARPVAVANVPIGDRPPDGK
jgi:hypothetical protein